MQGKNESEYIKKVYQSINRYVLRDHVYQSSVVLFYLKVLERRFTK
jgi:hypothetical protein